MRFLIYHREQLENYQKPCNNDTHGYDGPIAISNGGQITPLAYDFLRASDAIGIPYSGMISSDLHMKKQLTSLSQMISRVNCLNPTISASDTQFINSDLDTAHASEIWAKYINRHTGRRSDAATGEYDEL